MARIYRKTEYTAEQRAEIDQIRKMPKAELSKTTGEKINSEGYNALMQLVSALRERREEMGVSQVDLAKRMGIEASALCRLESFKVINPTVWTLLQWAEALDCTIPLALASQPNDTIKSASN